LICCADGGTKLDQWKPGELLFDNAVNNARLAQRTSEIVGVLWHQGESDCSEELYPTYQTRFESMMQTLRNELMLRDVPFILGGLGDFLGAYSLKDYVHINAALKNIAESNQMVGFVSAEGLTSNPDHLHFNASSLYEFGSRYFEVFESLRPEPKNLISENIESDIQRSEMELL